MGLEYLPTFGINLWCKYSSPMGHLGKVHNILRYLEPEPQNDTWMTNSSKQPWTNEQWKKTWFRIPIKQWFRIPIKQPVYNIVETVKGFFWWLQWHLFFVVDKMVTCNWIFCCSAGSSWLAMSFRLEKGLQCVRLHQVHRCFLFSKKIWEVWLEYLGLSPLPVRVTTRIITFLVGNPYKPSFATVTGWGVDPMNTTKNLTSMGWVARGNFDDQQSHGNLWCCFSISASWKFRCVFLSKIIVSWLVNQPPLTYPPRNKGLIRPY